MESWESFLPLTLVAQFQDMEMASTCMLLFLASLTDFGLAEATAIECAHWLHQWLETHLERSTAFKISLD